jgi:hypothetical protein
MLSGMPSRRLAESPRLWVSIALAAGAGAAAFAARHDPPPPPPPEPEIIVCAIPAAPACRPGELTTPSGIRIVTVVDSCGSGPPPIASDTVEVEFAGWNARGERIAHMQTGTFPLTAVVPGFAEVVRGMRVGDRVRAEIPGSLAYDSRNDPKLRGTLTFEIALRTIVRK